MLKKIQNSFKLKIIFLLTAISLASSIPAFYSYYTTEKQKLYNILEIQITQLVHRFSLAIDNDVRYNNYYNISDDIMDTFNYSKMIKNETGSLFNIQSIAVTDLNGNIYGHSDPEHFPLLTPYKHFLLSTGELDKKDNLKTILHWNKNNKHLEVRAPILFESEVIGFIFMDIDAVILKKEEQQLMLHIATIFLILLIVLISIIYLISNWIEKPLSVIMQGIGKLGSGQLKYPELENRADEFQTLASALIEADHNIHEKTQLLVQYQNELENKVKERTRELQEKANDLNDTLEKLTRSQTQLIETEKMSALGSLVAGVAHEVNTPIGVSLTGITHIQSETRNIIKALENDTLGKNALQDYLDMIDKMANSMHLSLVNAASLIRSFKQVAVEQHVDEKRVFNLKEYYDEVLLSLHSKIKHTQIKVSNKVDNNIMLNSYAGIFSQILTNLIMNSLIHAFSDNDEGNIDIYATFNNHNLIITYTDNGKGIDEKIIKSIFEPFFTTRLGKGGSGLGLNIIFNLITHKLKGNIHCKNHASGGVKFIISIPETEII